MTKARKNYRGDERCEDRIILEDNKVLSILTNVIGQQLITTATVLVNKDGIETHTMHDDYYIVYARRVLPFINTKMIEEQHRQVLASLDDIKLRIDIFYKIQDPATPY